MNSITLIGHLGRDPEKRVVGTTEVAKFPLATSRTYKNKQGEKVTDTQWHTIEAWGAKADILSRYVSKGHKLAVQGELRYDKYTNKDGVEVTAAKIVLQEFMFLEKAGSNGELSKPTAKANDGPVGISPELAAALDSGDDEDLPFVKGNHDEDNITILGFWLRELFAGSDRIEFPPGRMQRN